MRRVFVFLLGLSLAAMLGACGDNPTPDPLLATPLPLQDTKPLPTPRSTALPATPRIDGGPETPTTIARATLDSAATAGAVRQAEAEAGRATEVAGVFATQTEEARPTDTPVPTATPEPPRATATPQPGIGSTIVVGDWELTLRKTRSRTQIVYNGLGQYYKPSGTFWLIYVDARNTANSSALLRDSVHWGLVDDHDATYGDLWTMSTATDQDHLARFINSEGRDPLYGTITPRGTGHPLLIFDVASDATPATLAARSQVGAETSWVSFDLR